MHIQKPDSAKLRMWQDFATAHEIEQQSIPLFDIRDGCVTQMPYGRDGRFVLKRSEQMEAILRSLGRDLIRQHAESKVEHDGLLYLMLSRHEGRLSPLYIGKAELFGKGDGNLSANISDLASGNGKFGRWGYNYAYHLGDLSAVTCDGHPASKVTHKYTDWRNRLFTLRDGLVIPQEETLFWATLWGPRSQSIWREYGATRLAFEEYLVIGVASDVFPGGLLNREGRTR